MPESTPYVVPAATAAPASRAGFPPPMPMMFQHHHPFHHHFPLFPYQQHWFQQAQHGDPQWYPHGSLNVQPHPQYQPAAALGVASSSECSAGSVAAASAGSPAAHGGAAYHGQGRRNPPPIRPAPQQGGEDRAPASVIATAGATLPSTAALTAVPAAQGSVAQRGEEQRRPPPLTPAQEVVTQSVADQRYPPPSAPAPHEGGAGPMPLNAASAGCAAGSSAASVAAASAAPGRVAQHEQQEENCPHQALAPQKGGGGPIPANMVAAAATTTAAPASPDGPSWKRVRVHWGSQQQGTCSAATAAPPAVPNGVSRQPVSDAAERTASERDGWMTGSTAIAGATGGAIATPSTLAGRTTSPSLGSTTTTKTPPMTFSRGEEHQVVSGFDARRGRAHSLHTPAASVPVATTPTGDVAVATCDRPASSAAASAFGGVGARPPERSFSTSDRARGAGLVGAVAGGLHVLPTMPSWDGGSTQTEQESIRALSSPQAVKEPSGGTPLPPEKPAKDYVGVESGDKQTIQTTAPSALLPLLPPPTPCDGGGLTEGGAHRRGAASAVAPLLLSSLSPLQQRCSPALEARRNVGAAAAADAVAAATDALSRSPRQPRCQEEGGIAPAPCSRREGTDRPFSASGCGGATFRLSSATSPQPPDL
ncbi:unnamed protein product [Ectocarpus sp. 6 AP-2014]